MQKFLKEYVIFLVKNYTCIKKDNSFIFYSVMTNTSYYDTYHTLIEMSL